MQGSPKRKNATLPVVTFSTAALLIGALLFCGIFYLYEAGRIEKSLLVQESNGVNAFAQILQNQLNSVSDDLRELANDDGLRSYAATGQPADLDRATQRAVFYSRLNAEFDQIRYLDERGREVMRVNQKGLVVPPGELQDKSDRDYFKKGFALAPGKIYVSSFDLNIENGRVEQPPKPVLRFATPVFDAGGQRRGVYVINKLGSSLFSYLQRLRPDVQHRLRVFNAQGYWLKAAQPEQEWGFMFPERGGLTLARTDPGLWARVLAEPAGRAQHSGGELIWQRIDLRQTVADNPDSVVAEDQFLVIASEISDQEFGSLLANLRVVFGSLTVLLLGVAFIATRHFHLRRQANQALRRSEQEFRSMAEAMPQIVWATRPDGWNIFFNQQWVDYTGLTLEESHGHGWNKPFHPDDQQRAWDAWQRATQNNERYSLECRLRRADGVYRWWLIRGAQMRDANGEVVKWFGTCTDIEDSKQAEEALRRSEEDLAVTLQSIGDAVLATDAEGRVTRLNLIAEKLTGWTHAEALGRPVAEVFQIINEVTREPSVIPVDKVLASGEIHGLANHTIIIARDGKEYPIADSAAPIRDKEGKILGVVLVFRDVTEEHAAQRALRESEQRVRLAIEAADIGVWAWDIASGAIHWDDRMFAFYGLPPKPDGWVTYEDWRARVLPDEIEEQAAELQRTVATCGHSQREFRITRASDQAVRVIHAAEMAIPGMDGKAARVVGINIDITDRKQMENAVRDSESLVRSVLNSMMANIAVVDASGKIIAINDGWEQFARENGADASLPAVGVGANYLEVCERATRDLGAEAQEILNGIHGVLAHAQDTFKHEYACHSPTEQRWFNMQVSPLARAEGGAVIVQINITERKQVERVLADFKAALDEHAIVAVADARGKITYVNDKFCAISKYAREELLGQDHRIINSGFHPKEFIRDLWQTIISGRVWHGEIKNRAKDGTIYWVDTTIVPFIGGDGKPLQFIAIRADVTARMKAQEELVVAHQAVQSASQAKSEFLATMSHELRTPLNGIIGMNDLLLSTELNERQQKYVQACSSSGKLLLQLINDILDLSKIEAGKLELDPRECDIEALAYDVADMMLPSVQQKGLALRCRLAPEVCVIGFCDDNRLRQVLVNLVNNAMKFTSAGSVTINGARVTQPDGGVRLRFSVVDTGIGIPAERRDRLFQAFSQVDSSTTRQFGGTGLGLSICRQLVELMGGEIGVESQVGIGSTFWFEIPVKIVSENHGWERKRQLLAGVRFLAIDGLDQERRQIADCLQSWGCPFEQVATCTQALDAVTRAIEAGTPFNLVLADCRLVTGDEYVILQKLATFPGLHVIGLGALSDDSSTKYLYSLGVRHVLSDPVRPSALLDAISSVLSVTEGAEARDESRTARRDQTVPIAGHVLVAEDNRINQLYIVDLLKDFGCTVDLVTNGEEALAAVERRRYDLVLMDCQMPEMDGFTATREIRKREAAQLLPGRLPILALTANALKGDRQQCLDAGMDDYASKPVDGDHLRSVLEKFLGQPPQPETGVVPIAE